MDLIQFFAHFIPDSQHLAILSRGLQYLTHCRPGLLAPAMQTHLLFYKSADPLTRRLKLHKLEMCMLIMEELQKTYSVASLYRGIFLKAMEQICPSYQTKSMTSDQAISSVPRSDSANRNHTGDKVASSQSVAEHVGNTTSFTSASGQDTDILGDFMDSLIDDSSIFNFWEIWN